MNAVTPLPRALLPPHELDSVDRLLIAAIQDGLPLTPQPYAEIGRRIGLSEARVLDRLENLLERGLIKRLGVVVRHRKLGYTANAMVVWDLPDSQVDEIARGMSDHPFVTLCYRRPRRPPHWPYNLFCMIHGRDRDTVLGHVDRLVRNLGLEQAPHEVLFSRRCFKQRGARFLGLNPREAR